MKPAVLGFAAVLASGLALLWIVDKLLMRDVRS